MNSITIGITCGDINGVGLEVIIKAIGINLAAPKHKLVVYGSTKVAAYHKNILTEENIHFHTIETPSEAQAGRINVINCWNDNVNITLGKPTDVGGKCAAEALERPLARLRVRLR